MATASAINTWLEELAISIIPQQSRKTTPKARRAIDLFRRRVRNHNFARTNQFDVSDQLDGLEEKFQILNRDDLSEALFERRIELRGYYERWIPDVLDLLIRTSNDPVRKTKITDLSDAIIGTEPEPQLKWADIIADDPLDKNDLIWKVPNFSDLSSDEDDIEVSTAATSPASSKRRDRDTVLLNTQLKPILDDIDTEAGNQQLEIIHSTATALTSVVTEVYLIRQTLLLAQGYPSPLFRKQDDFMIDARVRLKNVSNDTLGKLLAPIQTLRSNLDSVKYWIEQSSSTAFIQCMKQSVQQILEDYVCSICMLEDQMLHPTTIQAASVLGFVSQIEGCGEAINILAKLVRLIQSEDAVSNIDVLYDMACEYYFTDDSIALEVVLPVFVRVSSVYLRPIEKWLETGTIDPALGSFFIHPKSADLSASSIWHACFELRVSGPDRPVSFLSDVAQDVFACGKTLAFINQISNNTKYLDRKNNLDQSDSLGLVDKIQLIAADQHLPFSAALAETLKSHFSSLLTSRTARLRNLLETQCGMEKTLDAFEYIYLRKQGFLLDTVETKIFHRIDKCMDNWNDRFLVADMLEDVYSDVNCINIESISVHSARTSSRSMQSRRRSVRILGALAIDYAVPWPIANIISRSSLVAYRRVALHLLQIRRAKFILDRTAYIHAQSTPISNDPKDQHLAQITTFMLLQFANTLYDHFTTGIALPFTTRMRDDLQAANNVDAMIAVHEDYIANMEFACLTSKQLRLLHETLVGLLDMCIRFADLMSRPANANDRKGEDDDSDEFEAGSFTSARSQRRGRRKLSTQEDRSIGSDSEQEDEEDDFADEGEGYSSFIVLDEGITVAQEIRKLQVQFKRQLDFFIAGLRGVGRGGSTVDEFEMLADRLEWKGSS